MHDEADDEHALLHRLGELEGEIALVEEIRRAAADAPEREREREQVANAARYDADLARLRAELADVLGRLGERGRAHRVQAHNDHQRRLRAAVLAYNEAASRMRDALREAQALAPVRILLPTDAPRAGEAILAPPVDFAALARLTPPEPLPLVPGA